MDDAARKYIRALNDRATTRKNPPHDVFELQNRVRNYADRLTQSRAAVEAAVRAQYGPSRAKVTRPAPEGVYRLSEKNIVVRRGSDAPAVAFWNVAKNKSVYLERRGREWVIKYGPDAGTPVALDEHWTPGGLR